MPEEIMHLYDDSSDTFKYKCSALHIVLFLGGGEFPYMLYFIWMVAPEGMQCNDPIYMPLS